MNVSELYRSNCPASTAPVLGLVLTIFTAGNLVGAAPTPVPTATATATPAPAAAATAGAGPAPTYDGTTQSRYIATANTAFVAQRTAKFQAFMDARTAFEAAGGIDPKGLTSKAAVTERRTLLAPLVKANDDYLAFLTTEETSYRAELAKTGLVPSDVDAVATEYVTKANVPRTVKVQELEKNLLADADQMLAALENGYGGWSLTKTQKLTFKKKSLLASYSALENAYNAAASEMRQLQQPAASPSPSPAPSPSPVATTP